MLMEVGGGDVTPPPPPPPPPPPKPPAAKTSPDPVQVTTAQVTTAQTSYNQEAAQLRSLNTALSQAKASSPSPAEKDDIGVDSRAMQIGTLETEISTTRTKLAADSSALKTAKANQTAARGAAATAQHYAPPKPKVTVKNTVTQALNPVVTAAKKRAATATHGLNTVNTELANTGTYGVNMGVLTRIRMLNQQKQSYQHSLDSANATIAAASVVGYKQQAQADTGQAQTLAQPLLKSGVINDKGALTKNAAKLTPTEAAAYARFNAAQAKVNADVAAGNQNYYQLQVYASDPHTYGSIATDAVSTVNAAVPAGQGLPMPDRVAPRTAQANLAAATQMSANTNAAYGVSAALAQYASARSPGEQLQAGAALDQANTYATQLQDTETVQADQQTVKTAEAAYAKGPSGKTAKALTTAETTLGLDQQQLGIAHANFLAASGAVYAAPGLARMQAAQQKVTALQQQITADEKKANACLAPSSSFETQLRQAQADLASATAAAQPADLVANDLGANANLLTAEYAKADTKGAAAQGAATTQLDVAQYQADVARFNLTLPADLADPQTAAAQQAYNTQLDSFFASQHVSLSDPQVASQLAQLKPGQKVDVAAGIKEVQGDLTAAQQIRDNRGLMQEAWDWLADRPAGTIDYLNSTLNQLEALNKNQGHMSAAAVNAQYLKDVGNLSTRYGVMSQADLADEQSWSNAQQAVVATVATIGAMAAASVTGGALGVLVGTAAYTVLKQGAELAQNGATVAQGGDLSADGGISIFTPLTDNFGQGGVTTAEDNEATTGAEEDLVTGFTTAASMGVGGWARGAAETALVARGATEGSALVRIASGAAGMTGMQATMAAGQIGAAGFQGSAAVKSAVASAGFNLATAPLLGLGDGLADPMVESIAKRSTLGGLGTRFATNAVNNFALTGGYNALTGQGLHASDYAQMITNTVGALGMDAMGGDETDHSPAKADDGTSAPGQTSPASTAELTGDDTPNYDAPPVDKNAAPDERTPQPEPLKPATDGKGTVRVDEPAANNSSATPDRTGAQQPAREPATPRQAPATVPLSFADAMSLASAASMEQLADIEPIQFDADQSPNSTEPDQTTTRSQDRSEGTAGNRPPDRYQGLRIIPGPKRGGGDETGVLVGVSPGPNASPTAAAAPSEDRPSIVALGAAGMVPQAALSGGPTDEPAPLDITAGGQLPVIRNDAGGGGNGGNTSGPNAPNTPGGGGGPQNVPGPGAGGGPVPSGGSPGPGSPIDRLRALFGHGPANKPGVPGNAAPAGGEPSAPALVFGDGQYDDLVTAVVNEGVQQGRDIVVAYRPSQGAPNARPENIVGYATIEPDGAGNPSLVWRGNDPQHPLDQPMADFLADPNQHDLSFAVTDASPEYAMGNGLADWAPYTSSSEIDARNQQLASTASTTKGPLQVLQGSVRAARQVWDAGAQAGHDALAAAGQKMANVGTAAVHQGVRARDWTVNTTTAAGHWVEGAASSAGQWLGNTSTQAIGGARNAAGRVADYPLPWPDLHLPRIMRVTDIRQTNDTVGRFLGYYGATFKDFGDRVAHRKAPIGDYPTLEQARSRGTAPNLDPNAPPGTTIRVTTPRDEQAVQPTLTDKSLLPGGLTKWMNAWTVFGRRNLSGGVIVSENWRRAVTTIRGERRTYFGNSIAEYGAPDEEGPLSEAGTQVRSKVATDFSQQPAWTPATWDQINDYVDGARQSVDPGIRDAADAAHAVLGGRPQPPAADEAFSQGEWDAIDNLLKTDARSEYTGLSAAGARVRSEVATDFSQQTPWTRATWDQINNYVNGARKSVDPTVRDAAKAARTVLKGRGREGPADGEAFSQAESQAINKLLTKDATSQYTGAKDAGTRSSNAQAALGLMFEKSYAPWTDDSQWSQFQSVLDGWAGSGDPALQGAANGFRNAFPDRPEAGTLLTADQSAAAGELLISAWGQRSRSPEEATALNTLSGAMGLTKQGRQNLKMLARNAEGSSDDDLKTTATPFRKALRSGSGTLEPSQLDAAVAFFNADRASEWVGGNKIEPTAKGTRSTRGEAFRQRLADMKAITRPDAQNGVWRSPADWRAARKYAGVMKGADDPVLKQAAAAVLASIPHFVPPSRDSALTEEADTALNNLLAADSASWSRARDPDIEDSVTFRKDRNLLLNDFVVSDHIGNVWLRALVATVKPVLGVVNIGVPTYRVYGEFSGRTNEESGFALPGNPTGTDPNGRHPNLIKVDNRTWATGAEAGMKWIAKREQTFTFALPDALPIKFEVGIDFRRIKYLFSRGGRPGYTNIPEGTQLTPRVARKVEIAFQDGTAPYHEPGMNDGESRDLYRIYSTVAPWDAFGNPEWWRSSSLEPLMPRESDPGPHRVMDRNDVLFSVKLSLGFPFAKTIGRFAGLEPPSFDFFSFQQGHVTKLLKDHQGSDQSRPVARAQRATIKHGTLAGMTAATGYVVNSAVAALRGGKKSKALSGPTPHPSPSQSTSPSPSPTHASPSPSPTHASPSPSPTHASSSPSPTHAGPSPSPTHTGPGAPKPPSHKPQPGQHAGHPPSTPNQSQFAVLPPDGLNARSGPSTADQKLGAFPEGSFVVGTGQTAHDAAGNTWLKVTGLDSNGSDVEGWVEKQYITPHPQGAEGPHGRINPTLAKDGDQPVTVEPGQTMSGIAEAHDLNPSAVERLNSSTFIDPNSIDPGDTVYLPPDHAEAA